MALKTIVLDPCGAKSPKVYQLARRPRTLHGIHLGLLDNLKPNATFVLERATALLAQRYDLQSVTKVSKRSPTAPASKDIYDQLEKMDLVLLAVADCGGCAAWTVHDAVELERRGVPTITFVSEAFATIGESHARIRGLTGLPVVTLPEPFGQLSADEVRQVIDSVFDNVVEISAAPVPARASVGLSQSA